MSTRRLVDTLAEQALLEDLIDGAKPPDPAGGRLHYLLSTPFRYPPLPWGSRFGRQQERGIWYGAESVSTAMAEVAYYRFAFLEGTSAPLRRLAVELTAFRASVRARKGVDLVSPPFDAYKRRIASRTSYASTQPLGTAMRAAGVEVCRYPSARDPDGGVNIAVFSPSAFAPTLASEAQHWTCSVEPEICEVVRRDPVVHEVLVFSRASFLVGGELPLPGFRA
ncbi:MAG: RES family NAD+ phosphorylase [Gemmatimonadota bacterium]